MYSHGKTPKRSLVKEGAQFGPQFTVQASATNVTERPSRQFQKEGFQIKQNDVINATNFSRTRSSNSNVETNSVVSAPERGMSGAPRTKRSVLPSAAYAHDLTCGGEPLEDAHLSRSGSSASRNGNSTPVYLPGDRVIFAESANAPGIPVVYRTPDERSANPDRLNLDRRRLTVCPILEGEEQLRLLNYQHNYIREIKQLTSLKRLIFLDLYDNQIQEISGLSNLRSLRVLMLGKNRITRIENLEHLSKLDVLDLHGNQIRKIGNLSHLQELRVLNLAGNLIEEVYNLTGMEALTELNLRRNKIRSMHDVDNLRCLQRLFLSFNEITCFEDISCLSDCPNLTEISLDGNPFQQDPNYKKTVIRHMQQLRQFDMKRISDDEKRTAALIARKEDDKKLHENKLQIMKDRRRLAINNAKRQWEVMQGGMMTRSTRVIKNAMPELYANHVTTVNNLDVEEEEPIMSSAASSRPASAKSVTSQGDATSQTVSRSTSQTTSRNNSASSRGVTDVIGTTSRTETAKLNHLAELEGDTLTLYGIGALDAFDKSWGLQAAGAVTNVIFKFIEFDEITKHLHKIRVRFPNVHTLLFTSTKISNLQQINALSAVRRLENLTIETDGNPITQYALWKAYVLYRLAHFNLKKINDLDVTPGEVMNAEKTFGTLSHMTTSQLPQSRLLALLGDSKRKHLLDDKKKPSSSDGRLTDRGSESVGKAGLIYSPPDTHTHKDIRGSREFVSNYVKQLANIAVDCDRKQAALHKQWPQLLDEMVRAAVIDMWDTQTYARKCMEELEKS